MCTCGNKIIKQQKQKQQHIRMFVFMFFNYRICVVLRYSVCLIGSWNYPKVRHKIKYA
jgi:hypothetical protein